MPPPVPPVPVVQPDAQSDSESDHVSDSEPESSDESIDNDPLKTEDMSDSGHGTSVAHVLGRLPDNPKRKADYDDGGDHPSKAQRLLTSSGSPSSSSSPDADSSVHTHAYIARQSFAAPSTEQATRRPCFELLQRTFPQYHPIPLKKQPFFMWLCNQPVKRIPVVGPSLFAMRRGEGTIQRLRHHPRAQHRRTHSGLVCQLLVWKERFCMYAACRRFPQQVTYILP
ncbi:hypothetical protein QBC40DRAFT_306137 [Triangularia verruculosa]|uniref:Uncharacterized protein n=1 Tax=Triangularia verruculosa TaxID=2587418 RepID=A0AAN6XNT7_9PEZI|nr:hypothetical protein QBC40DRAFT_306137 [Triangularia verruculosa]